MVEERMREPSIALTMKAGGTTRQELVNADNNFEILRKCKEAVEDYRTLEKMVGAVRFELVSRFIGFHSKTSYSQ